MNDSFKDRVIKRRKEIGLSQLDLANALGYTPQAISKFENSSSAFPVSILPKLANALDTTIDSFFSKNSSSFQVDRPYKDIDASLLANNLKELRKRDGLTIGEEAKKLDISPRSLSAYENDETIMPVPCFELALISFNISASELLYKPQKAMTEPVVNTEATAPGAHHFWNKKIIAIAASLIVVLAVAIPTSIVYAMKNKGTDSSATSSHVITEADFPTDYSIEPVGFSVSSPLTVGDYSFRIVLPDDYVLPDGISIQWGYSGESTVADITQENENDMTGIFHIKAIYWKNLTIGVQAALIADDYFMTKNLPFQIHNDNGQINPNYFPGLNGFYLDCPTMENGIMKKGSSYEVYVRFINAEGMTFTFDKEKYTLKPSGTIYQVDMNYTKDDPFFVVSVASDYNAGSSVEMMVTMTPVNTTANFVSSPLNVTIE